MDTTVAYPTIAPPASAGDTSGAIRVFSEFLDEYEQILVSADQYLQNIMDQIGPEFAPAYRPWQKGVRDLLQGVFVVTRKLPVRNAKAFADALRLFSLDSAIAMLSDICISCKIALPRHWVAAFRKNIRVLSEAFRVLYRQRGQALGH